MLNNVTTFITQRYSRQGLWLLFLICAFPIHFWTLIMVFRDVSWVSERTNAWDAIGVVSYGMIFALAESVVIFAFVMLMGFFTPKQWEQGQRIAFLGLLFLITSIWGMIGQLLFLWNVSLPTQTILFLRNSGHPLRFLYAGCLMIVIPTVLLPVYSFMRSNTTVTFMQNLMERLSLLTMFYLFFDLLGLIVVLLRNLS